SVGPRVEVVADGDGAARAPRLPDAPVLLERGGADDGRGVDPRRLVDVIRTTVTGDRAPERPGGPEGAPVVDDVVLHERVRRPAVEGQIRVALRVEAAGVGHGPGCAGAPALTEDEVAGVAPRGAVVAARTHGHGDRSGRV